MGASVKEIDHTYGHLARDAHDSIRARLEARAAQPGVRRERRVSARAEKSALCTHV
jgi:hypothetical protein